MSMGLTGCRHMMIVDAQGFIFQLRSSLNGLLRKKKPGSIISMTIGTTDDDRADGGREDYLFHHLDVLINSLLDRGYSIVPVSTLMDHAQ